MKRFSKVLALVLAMTMIFSVVSVCASAADTTNAGFKIKFVDNAGNDITSVAAGQTANVIISIKTNGYSPIFAFLAFYDYTALTHIRQNGSAVQNVGATNCRELYGRFNNTGAYEDASDELLELEDSISAEGFVNDWGFQGNVTVTPHKDLMWDGIGFTDADKAKYKGINFGYLVPGTGPNLTVNTEGEWYDMVRFRFYAEKDTELNRDTFFLLDNNTKTYITIDLDDMPLRNGQKSTPVKVSNLTVEYEGGSAAPAVKVNNLSTQIQWADKDAGRVNLGFRGQIAEGYNATDDWNGTTSPTGGKELATLKEVGFYIGNGKYQSETIYDFANGGYFYRVIVGADYDDETTLSARAYVVIGGQEYKADSTITTSAKAEYTRATALENGMEAK